MPRTEAEIRAELARWVRERLSDREAGRDLEAAGCTVIISTLAWALGETEHVTDRFDLALPVGKEWNDGHDAHF